MNETDINFFHEIRVKERKIRQNNNIKPGRTYKYSDSKLVNCFPNSTFKLDKLTIILGVYIKQI